MHWLIFPCPGKTPRWWCTAIVLPHGGHSSIPQSATGPRGCVRVNSYPLLLISAHREYSGSDGGPFPSMPWDAPELPRRVHVLAAPCRRHPRHGTGRSGESHLPRSVQKVFAHVTLSWDAPELPRRVLVLKAYCRDRAVTIRDTGELTKLVRRVFVLTAPCRHHPRHGTGGSGQSHLPRSGRKYSRTSPCLGMRPGYQGVSLCSRHPAVAIRQMGHAGPDETVCRGPHESICVRHRAVGVARVVTACSRHPAATIRKR